MRMKMRIPLQARGEDAKLVIYIRMYPVLQLCFTNGKQKGIE